MAVMSSLVFVVSALFLRGTVGSSIIETFTDANCATTATNLTGPDGHPSGRCSQLSREGAFSSFKIMHLDAGCVVTIYGKDTDGDSCSGAAIVAQQFDVCYNSSWVDYSIDECTGTGAAQSSSSAPSSSSTSTLSSAVGTSSSGSSSKASTTSTSTPGASSTQTSSTSSQSSNATSAPVASKSSTDVGAIAGGVVGGVAAVAILGALAFLLLRRKRKQSDGPIPEYHGPATELDERGKNIAPAAQELHSQSAYVAEMQGTPVHEMPDHWSVGEAGKPMSFT